MAISLKVLAPNKNVYQGEAEEVILPSTTGQLGILPGHISLVTAIDIGVLRLRMNSQWQSCWTPKGRKSVPGISI